MPVDVTIPQLGESITEAEIVRWLKLDGDLVTEDEPIAEVETDKATAELPAPVSGALEILVREGATVKPGDVVARIQESKAKPDTKLSVAKPPARPAPKAEPPPASTAPVEPAPAPQDAPLSPAARRLVEERDLDPSKIPASGRGGRLTKQDVLGYLESTQGDGIREAQAGSDGVPPPQDAMESVATAAPRETPREDKPARLSVVRPPATRSDVASEPPADAAPERRVRMSRLRRSIAQRLVEAQHTAAILTTFNEIDMGRVIELRARFKDQFAHTHGVSLGFMSFFARACVLALREVPEVGARIEGEEVVYSQHVHLGIAASTDRGLVVPVVRNADLMGLADLEREIGRLAELARSGRIGLDDLSGGTFTISNGGVFGSLLSTPILNPPQSGILGMHKIEKRPVVTNDQIVIRPMMYVALSYDHRLIDGREAVTFLVRVKEKIEDPERLLLEI